MCHDDKEKHVLDRKKVKMLKCMSCGTTQGVTFIAVFNILNLFISYFMYVDLPRVLSSNNDL